MVPRTGSREEETTTHKVKEEQEKTIGGQNQDSTVSSSSSSPPPRTPPPRSVEKLDDEEPGKDGDGEEDDEDEEEEDEDGDEDEDDEDDDEDEEPLLKYTPLTKNQGSLYRNGDAVSTFMVAGDKMIAGTHNGFIQVFSLPSFQSLKLYHAHSATVTAISISPYPPPLPTGKTKAGQDQNGAPASPKVKPETAMSSLRAHQPPIANTPSNNIHIATSSIDGHVVIQSLVEGRDVLRRNFGRPVHTVAVSPDFKNDRTYLSGGRAGNLIRTVGGTVGKTSTSSTVGGASMTAQGWLGAVGLGSDEGKDTVLHSGEGTINTVKWSLSGKYVVWINEQGIKIMRSHLHLDSTSEAELAWKRMSHIDRPKRQGWDELAGVWKARAEWVDEDGLETNADPAAAPDAEVESKEMPAKKKALIDQKRVERLLIGWGGSIWIMDVHPNQTNDTRASNDARLGRVNVVNILRTDCIISGLSLYTPNLLLVLAFITPTDNEAAEKPEKSPGTPSGGRRRKQNSLPPEIRIIDIRTKEEASLADTLDISRFDALSSADYHLDTLPVIRQGTKVTSSKGALETMGELGSNIYGGIWDVAMYPKHLISSGASIVGSDRDSDKASLKHGSGLPPKKATESNVNPALLTRGIKVFIHSPYDCVLATKPTIVDHFHWLESRQEYERAWNLLEERPEAAGEGNQDQDQTSVPGTPIRGAASIQDFFSDDAGSVSPNNAFYSQVAKEKRRIGDSWVGQLVDEGQWEQAAEVAGKVVDTAKSWNNWYWIFARAGKLADIVPKLPCDQLPNQPPLSPTVYEHALGHFITEDPPRLAEILDVWSTDLFDASIVINAIESRLRSGFIREDSTEDGQKGRYWRILSDGLAKLYLAAGRYRDALRAYIRLQDAETALSLIKTEHLAHAVADDIPSLIFLRVSKDQLKKSSVEELDEATTDIIQLLVTEAYQGIIPTSTVISQLKSRKDLKPFLFFYFRALWMGLDPNTSRPLEPAPSSSGPTNILSATFNASPQAQTASLSAARNAARELDESRTLVNDAADVALPLFASYSRAVFASFLRASQSYTLSTASQLCEEHDYVPELVFLLAKEGRARRALHLILDRLGDVTQAIAFAREQADAELWEDLVEYSLNRPEFVKVLLEEAGSAGSSAGGISGSGLDPVALVRRIPDGMEIEGLKEALGRMLREFELRASISEGVLKVCRGEVSGSMYELRTGQKAGVKFDIKSIERERPQSRGSIKDAKTKGSEAKVVQTIPRRRKKKRRRSPALAEPGLCAACGEIFLEDEPKALISFPCSHVFHLPCLILYESMPPEQSDKEEEGSAISKPDTNDLKKNSGNVRDETEDDDDEDESDPEAELGLPEPEPDTSAGGDSMKVKVRYAKILRGRVAGGCPLTVHAVA